MEPNSRCQICFEEIKEDGYCIKFDCLHVVCLKCYPYIAFNLLSSSQFSINRRLLDSFEEKYACPLCSKGKALRNSPEINTEFLREVSNFDKPEPQKIFICDICDVKVASKFCESCKENNLGFFCDECAKVIHIAGKRKEHKLISIEDFIKNRQEFGCLCDNYLN